MPSISKRPLLRRLAALEKTAAKYRGKKLDWVRADCIRMARSHLINMGHRKLPKIPPYRSIIGARRALEEAGGSIEAILDGLLPRIAPAAMWPGDLALLRGTDGMDCVMICVGRKLMGWAEGADVLVNFIPTEIKAAWRA